MKNCCMKNVQKLHDFEGIISTETFGCLQLKLLVDQINGNLKGWGLLSKGLADVLMLHDSAHILLLIQLKHLKIWNLRSWTI